jgi:hypothetical protein
LFKQEEGYEKTSDVFGSWKENVISSAFDAKVKVRYYCHILVEKQSVRDDMDSEIDSFCYYIVLNEAMDIEEDVYVLAAVEVDNAKVF